MQQHNNTFFISQKYAYRNEIANSIATLLNFYTSRHSKILAVRFDIRYPKGYTRKFSNTDISRCMAYVIKKYKRYGLDPYYMWVREQSSRSKNCHYHCCILLNAHKVLSYSHVFKNVEGAWKRTLKTSVTGCVHHCLKDDDPDYNGKVIRRDAGHETYEARKQEVFNWLSYLAKAYSKAPDNDGMRNFGMSWIPTISTATLSSFTSLPLQPQPTKAQYLNLFGD